MRTALVITGALLFVAAACSTPGDTRTEQREGTDVTTTQARSDPSAPVRSASAAAARQAEIDAAAKWMDSIIAARTVEDRAAVALRYLHSVDSDLAERYVRVYTNKFLARGQVALMAADALHTLGRYAEAVDAYDVALKDVPQSAPRTSVMYARALAQIGEPREAYTVMSDAAKRTRLIEKLEEIERTQPPDAYSYLLNYDIAMFKLGGQELDEARWIELAEHRERLGGGVDGLKLTILHFASDALQRQGRSEEALALQREVEHLKPLIEAADEGVAR
jgi:tetratricopeptide (TPR) repeat protein